jgi:predicted transcriptional regulator
LEKRRRDPARADAVRRLLERGIRVTEVARFCNVSHPYVSQVRKEIFSLSAEFPPEVIRRVDEICRKRGITRSEFLRMLVYRYLEEAKEKEG